MYENRASLKGSKIELRNTNCADSIAFVITSLICNNFLDILLYKYFSKMGSKSPLALMKLLARKL